MTSKFTLQVRVHPPVHRVTLLAAYAKSILSHVPPKRHIKTMCGTSNLITYSLLVCREHSHLALFIWLAY